MEKIRLIAQREYLTRVRKKSFIVMSILGPLLIAGFYGLIFWSMLSTGEEKHIQIIDDSGLFEGKFESTSKLSFNYSGTGAGQLYNRISDTAYDAVLHIPPFDIEDPQGFRLYSSKGISSIMEANIRRTLEKEIEALRLKNAGIDEAVLESIKVKVTIETHIEDSEGELRVSSSETASIIGLVAGLIVYMFIFMYGVQVMRGVIEEKTSRIVEVIISSVKPFELMMGKILGIAGVGLTQLLVWLVLGNIAGGFIGTLVGVSKFGALSSSSALSTGNAPPPEVMDSIMAGISTLNLPLIFGAFIFYFIFGYLMYAALFGAIGSAVDSETDTQQFMLPVTLPLIVAIALSGQVIVEPYGSLAVFLSLFPLTSPVVMMIRLPFVGFSWELLLSMLLLVASFVGTTWMAGRIYRVGILMYGKKPSYKELAKWLFYR